MTKKTALARLIIVAIFALISAVLALVSFNIPFTNYRWNSFVGGLNFGNDVSGGIVASYDFKLVNDSDDFSKVSKEARSRIYSILNKYYTEPTVNVVGENKLLIQVGDNAGNEELDRAKNVLSQIGGESKFKVSAENIEETLTIKDIKSLNFENIAGTDTLVIEFNKSGKKILENMSQKCLDSYKNLVIEFNSENKIQSVPSEKITDGKLYISGGISKASSVALIINLENEDVGVKLDYKETKVISENITSNFSKFFGIVVLTISVLILAFMCVKYRVFGAIATASALIFLGIYSLLLNILPKMQITAGSFVGIFASILIFAFSTALLCEKIKEQFSQGKKLKMSFDLAYKNFLKTVLDFSCVLLILFVILLFVGSSSINAFASAVCVGILVNLFVSLIVTKDCFKAGILLFGKKTKAFNLKKEVFEHEEK